jgi:peptidyl-prolyl cis-trans isomerase SurA
MDSRSAIGRRVAGRLLSALGGIWLFLAAPLLAQEPDSTIFRIVAVVGNKPILVSEVQERANVELRDQPMPSDPKVRSAFLKTILQRMVDEELVVQAALQDTAIKVTDEEVTQSVDELFRNVRSRYQSEEQFRKDLQATGFQTLEEWRSFTSEQQRRAFLQKQFWARLKGGKQYKPIPPTEAEIREYFERNKASFRPQGEAISFRQIVISPTASDADKAVARAQADSILQELRKGGDFETAARRFSMDPGTREQGGSLNWIRRGQGYDPKFEDAAFFLKPGQISDPVETSFGYHLIQVQRTQPAEVQVRHILIMPVIDSARADSTRKLAEAVYAAIKAGASFDSLQRLYHDKIEEREANQFPLDRLTQSAPAYANAIRDVKAGELVPLFRLDASDPNRTKYAIVQLTARIPAGEVRFEDVRDRLRANLSDELAQRRFLERLRRTTYVDIRDICPTELLGLGWR